jgi:hypothetical protein
MIFLDFTQFGPPNAKAKAFQEGLAEGLKDAVEGWNETARPKHFTLVAMTLYGYQPRSAGHQRRKARLFHHQDPLVFTGRCRETTRMIRAKVIGQTGTGIKRAEGIHDTIPKYFFAYRGKAPNKGRELYGIVQPELNTIRDIAGKGVNKALGIASHVVEHERII